MSKKNLGSSIDDLLREENIFEEAQAQAIKEVVAWQLACSGRRLWWGGGWRLSWCDGTQQPTLRREREGEPVPAGIMAPARPQPSRTCRKPRAPS